MKAFKTLMPVPHILLYSTIHQGVRILVLLIALHAHNCLSQQAKKHIFPEDYSKWGNLLLQGISPKGGWVSYRMLYEDGRDTLFVRSATTGISYNFPKASTVKIAADEQHALLQLDDSRLCWLQLSGGEKKLFDNIVQADFDTDTGNMLFIRKAAEETTELLIVEPQTGKERYFSGVYAYAHSPDNVLALAMKYQILLLKGNKIVDTLKIPSEQVHAMTWSDKGSLAFFGSTAGQRPTLYYYNRKEMALHALPEQQLAFGKEHFRWYMNQLRFSDDGKSIYTDILSMQQAKQDTLVEVWKSSTFHEYPADKLFGDPANVPHLISWDPLKGSISRIGEQGRENTMILPGEAYALLRKPLPNTDRARDVGYADYYLADLSGEKEPYRISTASMGDGTVRASLCGRYLSFSEGSGVQLFDLRTRQLRDIGAELSASHGRNSDLLGCAGFTNDSKYLFVFDKYDLWLLPLGSGRPFKITKGAEQKTVYQIEKSHTRMAKFAGLITSDLDLEKGIVLSTFTKEKTNKYYLYTKGRDLKEISAPDAKISSFVRAAVGKDYAYLAQRNDTPSYIICGDGKRERKVYQSNAFFKKYEWPRFELLDYYNSKGDSLQAILIYPSNYDPENKYPMVTYIYERLSDGFHKYIQPTKEQGIGFSPASYFLDGYFVLMPDIAFTENEPGLSALDCVNAAVAAAIEHPAVNSQRIGIYGHSFGGYLVNYILTKTSFFDAAVSGAGASDPVNYYLTMNFHRSISNSWKFESGQYRIRATPMEHLEIYLRNSPMSCASEIVTPLLSWAGKDDDSVDFRQSISMHLALRRLGKESTLLLYPGQGHILQSKAAKADLTTQVKEWFDRYLKPGGD